MVRYLEAGISHVVELTLNGRRISSLAEPRMLLSDFLRERCGSTGTHVGCEHGVCGACTIHVNGVATRACLMFAVQAQDAHIRTVEGLAAPNQPLNRLQQAFRTHHALQCGFCTPGILMTLTQLVEQEPAADEERVREVLGGHLCRCTGYQGIVDAALEALRTQDDSVDV